MKPGYVNVDFADVRTVMADKGIALMGVGVGTGERCVVEAAQKAINSPLLDDISISGATSLLVNITGSADLLLHEISEASTMIQEEAHEDANVIWGWVIDPSMNDEARVTVIATGFEESAFQSTKSVERRIVNVVNGGRTQGEAPRRGGRRSSMASGLNPDDYDFPVFFKHTD